ncbi:MAG: hypothetical protein QF733_06040 [Phycisphaerales bacterium]|jgi:hypothetical protein|nr:hypothetical protein [Phycisphaerales bacterium]
MFMNLLVIAGIALIGYWWANQGFLSSLLHLVAVICAGAVALALWEPIVVDNLLSTAWWSGLMPGLILLGTFVITLAILRMASDKLAFGNARLPRGIDMAGGGVLGAGAGVLTIGLLLVGTGYIDRPATAMGYTGWARDLDGRVAPPASPLWLPADTWTVKFYEAMSLGSLHPDMGGRPMAEWRPEIDVQSSLLRDRKIAGTRATQMFQPPDSVEVQEPIAATSPEGDTFWMVPMQFDHNAMDYGKGLALGVNQLRLVGDSSGGTSIIYPSYWGQLVVDDAASAEAGSAQQRAAFFEFNSGTAYVYDIGRTDQDVRMVFQVPDDFSPRFLQIRGTRFDIPSVRETDDWDEFRVRAHAVGTGTEETWGGDISTLVDMRGGLGRGSRPSRSDFKGDIEIEEEKGRITRANGATVGNMSRGKGKLRVKGYGLFNADGSDFDRSRGIIKIDVGPESPANIIAIARRMGGDGQVLLYDTTGGTYTPAGYERKDNVRTTLTFDMPIATWRDVRHPPRMGSEDRFELIFIVPVGLTLDRLMFDDEVVGLFEGVVVEPPSTR